MLSRIYLMLERKSVPLHSSSQFTNRQERVYPCTLLFLRVLVRKLSVPHNGYTGRKECTPTLFCPCKLTGKKECTPTLLLSHYTGRKECTPTLFPSSITRALVFLYPHTILPLISRVTLAGKSVGVHSVLPVNAGVNL